MKGRGGGEGGRVCLNVGVCVCMCRVSYRILSFGMRVSPKFSVDVERVCST